MINQPCANFLLGDYVLSLS